MLFGGVYQIVRCLFGALGLLLSVNSLTCAYDVLSVMFPHSMPFCAKGAMRHYSELTIERVVGNVYKYLSKFMSRVCMYVCILLYQINHVQTL